MCQRIISDILAVGHDKTNLCNRFQAVIRSMQVSTVAIAQAPAGRGCILLADFDKPAEE